MDLLKRASTYENSIENSVDSVSTCSYDENVTTRWCTFNDFKKYCYRNMTEKQKMDEFKEFRRKKAIATLKEADKYMVRNKHTYHKLAGDGLFSDVQVSRKIWERKNTKN